MNQLLTLSPVPSGITHLFLIVNVVAMFASSLMIIIRKHSEYAVMGLIGTRSLNTVIPGIEELVERAEQRIHDGIKAYDALQKIRAAGLNAAVFGSAGEHAQERERPVGGLDA